ncbi:MAG: hypothetical protein IPH77_14635 [Ignavibacteria bacterium]|nr:hypothetical protein [Ignavibacteria bacterium]
MALQEKYKSVIDSINAAGGRDVQITEDGGVLKVAATVPYPKDKMLSGIRSGNRWR